MGIAPGAGRFKVRTAAHGMLHALDGFAEAVVQARAAVLELIAITGKHPVREQGKGSSKWATAGHTLLRVVMAEVLKAHDTCISD